MDFANFNFLRHEGTANVTTNQNNQNQLLKKLFFFICLTS